MLLGMGFIACFTFLLAVDLVPLMWIQGTKPVEHLNINVPRSGSLSCPHRGSLQHLLLLLRRSACLLSCLARLRRLERSLIGVELRLGPH